MTTQNNFTNSHVTYCNLTNIWFYIDCKSGKCIKVIDPLKDKKLKGIVSCVSCIALDASESWLVRA